MIGAYTVEVKPPLILSSLHPDHPDSDNGRDHVWMNYTFTTRGGSYSAEIQYDIAGLISHGSPYCSPYKTPVILSGWL